MVDPQVGEGLTIFPEDSRGEAHNDGYDDSHNDGRDASRHNGHWS